MFKKSIEAIIAEGTSNLELLARQASNKAAEAADEVRRCQGEIQSLANLAKQVPEKVFDRYSTVLTATFDLHSDSQYSYVAIGGEQQQLRGLMGPEVVKPGRYRAIVLLEPIS